LTLCPIWKSTFFSAVRPVYPQCLEHLAHRLAGVKSGKGCAYVPTTASWLQTTGMWVGRTEPLPGDIAIFDLEGHGPHHIGIVEKSLGHGRFTAIEGNTSLGNDSNGGEVMRRERGAVDVEGFGRVMPTT